ncbi:hypothetical protein [Enterovibrio norvegicus]|uniref:hypothetical protein n=1 Tax=Enterovibrio norvegicus TaxID=188144 RepID=UPI00389A07E8
MRTMAATLYQPSATIGTWQAFFYHFAATNGVILKKFTSHTQFVYHFDDTVYHWR